ncbi:MAG: CoA-binding protein [Ignavibacteriaceae bacterium]|nr:CoA-binding protein [Ignavibacteriaceae bacterium]
MSSKQLVDEFINSKRIAVVGASSNPKKFGALCFKYLKERNYEVIPVNPKSKRIGGDECYADITLIPQKPDAALIVTPKAETLNVVKQAYQAGVNLLWIQQQSDTKHALDFCRANKIMFISGECIMMFSEPVKSVHRFHRFINKITGKLPV